MTSAAVDTSPGHRTGTTFSALRHRQYRWIWAASFVSQAGDWFLITGRAFLVYEITGSKAALGTIYFFSLIPLLLFSQISGVFADRFDRRTMLLISQAMAIVASIAIGVLASSGRANLVNLSAIAFAYGTIQAFSGPVQQAAVPSLVPRADLGSAIGLQSMTNSGSRIIGPALAGAILPIIGSAWLFYLNAISFGFVMVAWYLVRLPRQPPMTDRRTFRAAIEAIHYARQHRTIAVPLFAAVIVGGIGLSYSPQLASYASDYLAHGDSAKASRYYGSLQTAIGIGALVGVMLLPRLARRHAGRTLLAGVLGFGISLAALGLFHSVVASFIICMALGATQFATGAHALNLIQQNAPNEYRGRLISLYTIAFAGVFPIIGLGSGFLASRIGLATVLSLTGVVCFVVGLPMVRLQRHVTLAPPDR